MNTSRIKARRGDVVRVKTGPLKGTRGAITRISRATGGYTLQLLDACAPYAVGALVHVEPYECATTSEARK